MSTTASLRAAPVQKANNSNRASEKPAPAVLFESSFKTQNGRTYAAQIKKAANGNHFLVLSDTRHDPQSDEMRTNRVFVFSEEFTPFFTLLRETAQFIKANPVAESVRQRRP